VRIRMLIRMRMWIRMYMRSMSRIRDRMSLVCMRRHITTQRIVVVVVVCIHIAQIAQILRLLIHVQTVQIVVEIVNVMLNHFRCSSRWTHICVVVVILVVIVCGDFVRVAVVWMVTTICSHGINLKQRRISAGNLGSFLVDPVLVFLPLFVDFSLKEAILYFDRFINGVVPLRHRLA